MLPRAGIIVLMLDHRGHLSTVSPAIGPTLPGTCSFGDIL
jgi:hypothetical protein